MGDSLVSDFEQLKISAVSKYSLLKYSNIGQVTLGPNSIQNSKCEPKREIKSQKVNVSNIDEQVADDDNKNILTNNEIQRIKCARNNVQNRIVNMTNFIKQNELDHRTKWLQAQEQFIKCQREKEQRILDASDEFDRSKCDEHAVIERLHQDIEEQRKLRELELKQAEERKKLVYLNIESIKSKHQEFRLIYQNITGTIQKCLNKEKLREELGENYELLKILPNEFEEIRMKCKHITVTNEDIKRCDEIMDSLKNLSIRIKEFVDVINDTKSADVQKINPEPPPVNTTPINTEQVVIQKPTKGIHVEQNKGDQSGKELSMSKYVSMTNFKQYCEITSFLQNYNQTFQALENDASLKQFKFDCKKAVNIPVNSLSGVNAEHILDKYGRLHSLLSGQSVVISNKSITASKHPQGVAFCMDLLAKKLVLQGDLMVSSNPESAFCYSTLINSLWNEFPAFGQLVLAYFYRTCPVLVPYYIPREVGESDETFYQKCGYQYVDGQIETQDKFLKRITGISRLYFAILITKPKRGQNSVPHNLSHGWRWLSSILNLEPQVDVTATVLHTFLETIGFEMEARYGKMFLKLIQIIRGKFLKDCKEKCTGGAGTRLELLLNEVIKTGKFPQPSGYTNVSWW